MKRIYTTAVFAVLTLTLGFSCFAEARIHAYAGNKRIKINNKLKKYQHNNQNYYYQSGYFYSPADNNEAVIVNPPYGMHIQHIPVGCTKYEAHGKTFYIYNNISYIASPNGGYTIVETPPTAPKMHEEQGYAKSDPANNIYNEYKFKSADDLSVKIPNGDGTFTLVPMEKTEKGYKGPKGEIYENFPSIDDLKATYGKEQTTPKN